MLIVKTLLWTHDRAHAMVFLRAERRAAAR